MSKKTSPGLKIICLNRKASFNYFFENLIEAGIAQYKQASISNHNPTADRKLLLNKKEVNKLIGKMQRDGFTIVPTKMYFKKGKAKIELAVAKGKKQYDKRAVKKSRDWNRDKARYIRKSS